MKPLPTLKERKRYVVVKIISEKKLQLKDIILQFEQANQEFLGTLLLSKASIIYLKNRFNAKNQTLMIKVSNKYVKELISSLMLVKKIKEQKVIVKSVGVSGTIKKAATYL